jgi:hypothetical protein
VPWNQSSHVPLPLPVFCTQVALCDFLPASRPSATLFTLNILVYQVRLYKKKATFTYMFVQRDTISTWR